MGLDIYLYEREDAERRMEDDKVAWKAAFERTQAKSPNFPDHLCGPRYLRSSYNDGGFNHTVHNLIGSDLYSIFAHATLTEDEEGLIAITKEHLQATRERAREVKAKIIGARWLRCTSVSANILRPDLNGIPNEGQAIAAAAEAMTKFEQAKSGEKSGEDHLIGGSYWNALGHFSIDEPLEVVAMIPGRDSLGPAVHVVYKTRDDDKQWYVQMCDIIVEFCDEALAMRDPCILWSG